MSFRTTDLREMQVAQENSLPPIAGSKPQLCDFVPPDFLAALVSQTSTCEYLGPGKANKSKEKKCSPHILGDSKRPPDNLWHHPHSREKYKHLTSQPPCTCGAGRDISFLYDATKPKKKRTPVETERSDHKENSTERHLEQNNEGIQHEQPSISDSLIPKEFHIVKKPGVVGLEVQDEKYTTTVAGHVNHMTIFPSMNPSGRQEATKLANMMDLLLQRAGVDDEDNAELTTPTQIHTLLMLIKKEQAIYNLVFAEVIRQVSVDCAERGALLAQLRQRYVKLLDRVPRQVESLHEEILAQRALDRRLTEELTRFKSTIVSLTRELRCVQQHDETVTRHAEQTQDELNQALKESEKNAGLLAEFHDLYDLQRKRLERQIERLIDEKDIWAGAAYTMAIKVTAKHNLTTAKRLHLHEKSWHKLSRHFVIVLSDADSLELEELSNHVQSWHDVATKFRRILEVAEAKARDRFIAIQSRLADWSSHFHRVVAVDDGTVHPLDLTQVERLLEDFKEWEDAFVVESERFTGDALLAFEDDLIQMTAWMDKWTETGIKLFGRHVNATNDSTTRHPHHVTMLQLNRSVSALQTAYKTRMNGDNGVAKGIIDFINVLGTWINKLTSSLNGGEAILDTEWLQLTERVLNEWPDSMARLIELLAQDLRDKDGMSCDVGSSEDEVELKPIAGRIHDWLLAVINTIECADASLDDQLADTHSSMIRWMCTVLLRLAPDFARDKSSMSNEAQGIGASILSQATSDEIQQRGQLLVNRLSQLTVILSHCCHGIALESAQWKRKRMEDDAEVELNDLKRLTLESEQWIEAANVLTVELTGQRLPDDRKRQEENDDDAALAKGKEITDDVPVPKSNVSVVAMETEGQKESATHEPVWSHDSLASDDCLQVKVLCKDQNVTTHHIDHQRSSYEVDCAGGLPSDDMASVVEDRVHLPLSDGPLGSPAAGSPEQSRAQFLSSLDETQARLNESEFRAIENEQRALKAEEELQLAMKRIRELERALVTTNDE